MKLTSHERNFIQLIVKYKDHLKKNHGAKGNYFDFIFLCGAEKKPGILDNRSIVSSIVDKNIRTKSIYSEELFDFLSEFDLLTFEELLLEISTNVVIIVESWGSAAELGAFSFVDENLKKLIVINDEIHITKKSFINDGPLKKIGKYQPEKKKVFFEKFTDHIDRKILIVSEELSNKLENITSIETMKANPYEINVDLKILEVREVRYVLWLLIDIIRLFGMFSVNNSYSIFLSIFEVDSINIRTSSKNLISNQSEVRKIFDFLMKVLNESKLIIIEDDKYKINYDFFVESKIQINTFSNLLFTDPFLYSREFIKQRSMIINKLKKSGDYIWKSKKE